MLTAIHGVYRKGHVELAETPRSLRENTPVIVTFLAPDSLDLRARGIDDTQAADLRARLSAFAEDWDSPEMDVYNNYDAAKASLLTRLGSPRTIPQFRLENRQIPSRTGCSGGWPAHRSASANRGDDHQSDISRESSEPCLGFPRNTGW